MKITRPETLCLPITAHNCGGPVLTRACAHFNISTINAIQQETVRAIYRTLIGQTLHAAKAPFRRLYEAHSAAQ